MVSAVVLGFVVQQAAGPKVTFQDGSFKVTGALGTDIVPVSVPAPPRSDTLFRIVVKDRTVSFDKNGLSLFGAKRLWTSTLKAVPTSGKIATKESNTNLMRLVAAKERRLEVSALSGWELKGDSLYLLCRWVDAKKRPWLEVLLKMDLDAKRPEPQLVGRLPGLSFAQGMVDDVLVERAGSLQSVVNLESEFGIGRYDLAKGDFSFQRLGKAVSKAQETADHRLVWTLTATPYGTNLMGLGDCDAGSYDQVAELRGKMKGMVDPYYAVYEGPGGVRIANLSTGAETAPPGSYRMKHTAHGLLIWFPPTAPVAAELYDGSFRKVAQWVKPATPAPAAAKQPAVSKPAKTKGSTQAAKTHTPVGKKPAKKAKPKIVVTSRPGRSGRG